MASILIVEDELVLAHQLAVALEAGDHEVRTAGDAAEGLASAREFHPDLVLVDLRLPDASGLDLIGALRDLDPSTQIVLMTAYGSVRDAVEAMRRGAADYLNKPIDVGELGILIGRLLREQRQRRELEYLRGRGRSPSGGLRENSPALRAILEQVERLCDVGLSPGRRPPILLSGETGTGKGAVGRRLQDFRGGGPFIEVRCSALPRSRVELELFGSQGGDGPDAQASEAGLFEAAEGGTLLLDEVSDLGLELQGRFLTAIEERRIRRVGSTREREVDVHVVATTHCDLDAAVQAGTFRADLLHRLRVLCFRIPPLRERPAEILSLAQHFAGELGVRYRGSPRRLTPEANEHLCAYSWPGNVRELCNVIERAVLLNDGECLTGESVSALLDATSRPEPSGRMLLPEEGIRLADVEKDLLRQALIRARGNRTRASALLGLTRDTLRYRIAKLGLEGEGTALK